MKCRDVGTVNIGEKLYLATRWANGEWIIEPFHIKKLEKDSECCEQFRVHGFTEKKALAKVQQWRRKFEKEKTTKNTV